MKPKEDNLEQNISRLVKLAGDADKPSSEFVDSVMDGALDELKTPGAGVKREKSGKTTKSKWVKIFAYAASILILVIVLTMPTLKRACERSPLLARKAHQNRIANLLSQPSVASKGEPEVSKIAKFENTVADERVTGRTDYSDTVPPPPPKSDKSTVFYDISKGVISVVSYKSELTKEEIEAFLRRKYKKDFTKEEIESLLSCKSGEAGSLIRYCKPIPGPGGYPMAHGGTTPPNGEDVDAMFFKNYGVNPFVDTEDDHLSTFATDVDTGSYTIVRRYLHEGHLPPEKAVRVEEFINYFNYHYAAPQEDDFAVYAEAAPWSFGTGRKNSYLLRLGLKGKQISEENRKPAILTFVIDVSGSMKRENRLGLVKRSLRMLVERLREEDRIGIAVYGSRGRKVMDHRGLYEKAEILAAIESLQAQGSTNAEEGIRIGYEMAESAYRRGFINRIILCSDGVANVGHTFADDILEVIKKKAERGITLSAIGFGMGNYNDVLLERLGDKGNGHYVYIDTIAEARRVFEDNLTGTLQVIGRDVKVQVDFNPEVVRSYRLIGYENRDVPDEKFRDDKYDGGEIGAGHSVTALYELKLWPDREGTVATTYVRYKHAETSAITEFESPIAVEDFNRSFDDSSCEFKLAATVAEFAEILRKSYWAKGATLDRVLERAQQLSREFDGDADVIELVDLISKAERLMKDVEDDIFEIGEPVDVGEDEDEFLRP